jgi:hypothetical protein
MITITQKKYDALQERDRWLCALEAAGIDNTDAYSHAQEILEEWDEDSEDEVAGNTI